MSKVVALGIAAILLLVYLGWFFQWQAIETHPATGRASAFLVNRWTGEIRVLSEAAGEWNLIEKSK